MNLQNLLTAVQLVTTLVRALVAEEYKSHRHLVRRQLRKLMPPYVERASSVNDAAARRLHAHLAQVDLTGPTIHYDTRPEEYRP